MEARASEVELLLCSSFRHCDGMGVLRAPTQWTARRPCMAPVTSPGPERTASHPRPPCTTSVSELRAAGDAPPLASRPSATTMRTVHRRGGMGTPRAASSLNLLPGVVKCRRGTPVVVEEES